jgi:Flp pilus assembly protein TadD
LKKGDNERAIADFSEAIKITPTDSYLFLARAAALVKLARHEEALLDREEAVRLQPRLAEAYLARGGSYHQIGLHEKGLEDRTKAIELNPNLPEAWFARGSAYYLLGDYTKAHSDIAQALRLRPDYQEAIEVLQRTEGKLAEAKRDVPVVVNQVPVVEPVPVPPPTALVPESPKPAPPKPVVAALPPPPPIARVPRITNASAELLDQQGRTLTQEGKLPEAIATLTEAIRLKPDFSRAYNARGFAYFRQRDYQHALADFDQAIKLDPKYENAIQNRAATIRSMEHSFESRQAAKAKKH